MLLCSRCYDEYVKALAYTEQAHCYYFAISYHMPLSPNYIRSSPHIFMHGILTPETCCLFPYFNPERNKFVHCTCSSLYLFIHTGSSPQHKSPVTHSTQGLAFKYVFAGTKGERERGEKSLKTTADFSKKQVLFIEADVNFSFEGFEVYPPGHVCKSYKQIKCMPYMV